MVKRCKLAKVNIANRAYEFVNATSTPITIPDCWVTGKNKIGSGHGEAKLYIASKEKLDELFCVNSENIRCFLVKSDLIDYMYAVEIYFKNPLYSKLKNFTTPELNSLWMKNFNKINSLPDIIEFFIQKQNHIGGPRGYVNSTDRSNAYQLLREIALGDITYLSVMQLKDNNCQDIFYWKIFADFHEMERRVLFIDNYGNKNKSSEKVDVLGTNLDTYGTQSKGRTGQTKYREKMLEEFSFCFITQISEEALLVASHIKPYAACNDKEKYDPNNGFILSPLYDKLFDRGLITFSDDKRVHISNWLYPRDRERIGIIDNQHFHLMPLNDERIKYLKYHNQYVFKK